MSTGLRQLAICGFLLLAVCMPACAQDSNGLPVGAAMAGFCTDVLGQPEACPTPVDANPTPIKRSARPTLAAVPGDVLREQRAFWTSPFRLRENDIRWALPFALTTAGMIVADPSIDRHMASKPTLVQRSRTFSTLGVSATAASVGGMYLWGRFTGNNEVRRTGVLSGEALVNSVLASSALEAMTQRARPDRVDGSRGFGQGGDSFPSEHAVVAWSVASVVAHQHPGAATQLLAYGLAGAVTASRVTGRKHFASDALIGSALGWYIGREVYLRHLPADADNWGTFSRDGKEGRRPENMGSPYEPLDSWVYAVFDRLAAMGYVRSGLRELHPWTRLECARLVEEAGDSFSDQEEEHSSPAIQFYRALAREFAPELARLETGENTTLKLESLYTRFEGISGTPLRDGYHFGQTLVNDYGRPYGEGLNAVAGLSAYATAGPFAFYVRGEYQRSPEAPDVPAQARDAVANADHGSVGFSSIFPAASRLRLLDSYVALATNGFQLSFGRQSLWWGASESGGMLFSNNAEPIPMLRINRVKPFKLPSVLSLLGPMRTEFFIGQLSGHSFVATQSGLLGQAGEPLERQPYIHGQKFTFKPTPNLEVSLARTTIFGGPDFPFTSRRFFGSLFSTGNTFGPKDPGDRRSSFGFSYHVPRLRNRLVLYTDSFTDDEISPIAYPRRSGVNPGIYVPQVPGLRKMDFRLEGAYTPHNLLTPGFFYFNVRYLQGYTNNGQLLGHWIGRQGTAVQLWSRYWISPQSTIQFSYRNVQVDRKFLQGGQVDDYSARAELALRRDFTLMAGVQYERWRFPLLAPLSQANVTASFGLVYRPEWSIK